MKPTGIFKWAAVVIAVAAYAGFRIHGLTDGCLWFDEIFSVHAATMDFGQLLEFIRLDLIHPPLFYLLLKFWIMIGGESFLWLRLFPFFFSFAALIPLWLTMREFKVSASSVAGVLLLVGINGALIRYSQEVRMYAPLLFFGALSMWFFARFFILGKNIWLLLIANVLLVHVHYFGWILVFSEIAVIASMQRIKIRPAMLMLAGVLAAFAPWLLFIWRAPRFDDGVSRNIGWISRPDLGAIARFPLALVEPFYYPFQNVDPFSVYVVAIPMLAVIALPLFLIAKSLKGHSNETRDAFFVPAMLAVLPIVAAFVASWILPYSVWGTRHLIIVFFPFGVTAGSAFGSIENKTVRNAVAVLFVLIAAAGFVFEQKRERAVIVECAWADLAGRLPAAGGAEIYVFEDVAAYDVWFALRQRKLNYTVAKLAHPQIPEDKAYFLPRGFDGVRRAESFSGDRFFILFRDRWFDAARPPLRELRELGYKNGPPEVFDNPNGRVFLVEITR